MCGPFVVVGTIFCGTVFTISFADQFGAQRDVFDSPVSCDIRFCVEVLRQ